MIAIHRPPPPAKTGCQPTAHRAAAHRPRQSRGRNAAQPSPPHWEIAVKEVEVNHPADIVLTMHNLGEGVDRVRKVLPDCEICRSLPASSLRTDALSLAG